MPTAARRPAATTRLSAIAVTYVPYGDLLPVFS
jgi:hypothetical protein